MGLMWFIQKRLLEVVKEQRRDKLSLQDHGQGMSRVAENTILDHAYKRVPRFTKQSCWQAARDIRADQKMKRQEPALLLLVVVEMACKFFSF